MKYNDITLRIPWLGTDEEGKSTRNWSVLKFKGTMDRRRLKREVRKWAWRDLGRILHTSELLMLVHHGRIEYN